MKPMKDKVFIDSNIWLYLLGNDLPKKQKALQLLQEGHVISTQVVAENANVCRKKYRLDISTTEQHIQNLLAFCQVVLIQPESIISALSLSNKFSYSFYDSLIIASALESGCTILYSEDLHIGQVVNGQLKIANPFLKS